MTRLHDQLQLRREPSFADDLDGLFISYLAWRYGHRGADTISFNAIDVLFSKLFGFRCRVVLIKPAERNSRFDLPFDLAFGTHTDQVVVPVKFKHRGSCTRSLANRCTSLPTQVGWTLDCILNFETHGR